MKKGDEEEEEEEGFNKCSENDSGMNTGRMTDS